VLVRHNATLHIESTPGKGSRFRCDFPASEVVDVREEDAKPQVRDAG